jgi:glycosyltransferase involved in cell wall biosynthesis
MSATPIDATDLVVVMPIYNEEANIGTVLAEWDREFARIGVRGTIFAINDGSRDGTLQILKELESRKPGFVKVFDKANSGHGRSCRFGYDRACESAAEWVLQIDSDGQCDPGYFEQFWNARTDTDCVFGVRRQRDDGFARKLISSACKWLTMLVSGVALTDPNVPYRLMRREVLCEALKRVPADFNIHNVALTVALRRMPQVRWKTVPIRFRDRQGGSNSINIRNILAMGWGLLRSLNRVS